MRLLRTVRLQLGSINMHDGWQKEIDEETVADLVRDIQAGKDQSMPPVGLDQDGWLWWGHNRYEAYGRAGAKDIRCDVYAFASREEARAAAIRENLRRKRITVDQRANLIRELVTLTQERITKTRGAVLQPGLQNPPLNGRPLSPRGEAVREVAKDENVTRQAIEKLVNGSTPPPSPPPAIREETPDWPFPFQRFGLDVAGSIAEGALAAGKVCGEVDRLLRQGQGKASQLQSIPGFDPSLASDIHKRVHEVAHLVRQQMPAALCPWCKGQPDVPCGACQQHRGWVGAGVMAGAIPGTLLLEGDQAHVAIRGEFVPLSEWRNMHPLANGEVPDAF